MTSNPMTGPDTEAVAIASLIEAARAALGHAAVLDEPRRIRRYLRDFSWYSPILESALADTTVDAVIRPVDVNGLRTVVGLAATHRVPITLRGAGTGNYGQSLPLQRGIVVDVKGVAGVIDLSPGRIAVLPGTVLKTAEDTARETGQELAVMPSTYRVATASGFICGGSGGVGAAAHGDLWSGNVLAVEVLTVEPEPRTIRLDGAEVNSILHTYGTIGVVTRVEFRLVPARTYESSIVTFDNLADAVRFGWDLVASSLHARLVTVQQAPIGSMLTPIADAYPATSHLALVWSDAADHDGLSDLAAHHEGELQAWPENGHHITQFPYSHTILWSRRAEPDSSWLQCEYSTDRARVLEQVAAVEARYPGVFLQHLEFNTSPGGVVHTRGIPPIVGLPDHTVALDELITFCAEAGITVLNPHSYVVEEGGFVGDTATLRALKQGSDPLGILNPGKLGASFFVDRDGTGPMPGTRPDLASPEQLAHISDMSSA